jgi:Spy/CpxP family protein refolding chaperone
MKVKMVLLVMMLAGTLAVAQERTPGPPPPGPDGRDGMMRMPRHGFGPGMGMGGWWKNSELATELKLTDQQKQQLEKTFTDYRLQLIDQRAAVEREETKLQPLMDADQIDKAKVSTQLDALIAARSKLEKTSAMMHVAMREILTPEQWKQLQSMHMRRRGMSQGRGVGRGMRPGTGMRRQRPTAPAPPANTPPPAANPGGSQE